MIRSRLFRASITACALACVSLPAGARMLEFPQCAPPVEARAHPTDTPPGAGADSARGESDVREGSEPGDGPFAQFGRFVGGVAGIAWGMAGHAPKRFPRAVVADLPGAVPAGMTGYEMLWNAHDAGMLDVDFPSTRPLALWTASPSILILRDVDVRGPGDLDGLKIRVVGAGGAALVEALGAIPVHMPAGEIYASLETGLIDGIVTDPVAVGQFGLDAVAHSYTLNVPLGQVSFYVEMDGDRYDGLSDAGKAVVDRITGRALSQSAAEAWAAKAAEVVEQLKASGDNTVTILTADERAAFAAIALQVTEALVAETGHEDVLAAMQGR